MTEPIGSLDVVCRCTPTNELTTTATGIRVLRPVHADDCELAQYIASHDTAIPTVRPSITHTGRGVR